MPNKKRKKKKDFSQIVKVLVAISTLLVAIAELINAITPIIEKVLAH